MSRTWGERSHETSTTAGVSRKYLIETPVTVGAEDLRLVLANVRGPYRTGSPLDEAVKVLEAAVAGARTPHVHHALRPSAQA